MKEGLIAFLGFLAASLMQVMVVTANFLQSDRLTPTEATRLSNALTRQQKFWLGLLIATVAALVVVIVGSASKDIAKQVTYFSGHKIEFTISWAAVTVFLIASTFSFVFYRMFALMSGMMSLHRLRAELVLLAAQRAADEKASLLQERAKPKEAITPPGYGRILEPPKI
ncbi:hypothetical protein CTI10_001200 [Delftia acidovorans]|nr:hypothetical protein CTI10_001200 [Delftia acidovorans]